MNPKTILAVINENIITQNEWSQYTGNMKLISICWLSVYKIHKRFDWTMTLADQ